MLKTVTGMYGLCFQVIDCCAMEINESDSIKFHLMRQSGQAQLLTLQEVTLPDKCYADGSRFYRA